MKTYVAPGGWLLRRSRAPRSRRYAGGEASRPPPDGSRESPVPGGKARSGKLCGRRKPSRGPCVARSPRQDGRSRIILAFLSFSLCLSLLLSLLLIYACPRGFRLPVRRPVRVRCRVRAARTRPSFAARPRGEGAGGVPPEGGVDAEALSEGPSAKSRCFLEPFHVATALVIHWYGPPQRSVDSAKNDVFWRNANIDFCKKSTFICSGRKGYGRQSRRIPHTSFFL